MQTESDDLITKMRGRSADGMLLVLILRRGLALEDESCLLLVEAPDPLAIMH